MPGHVARALTRDAPVVVVAAHEPLVNCGVDYDGRIHGDRGEVRGRKWPNNPRCTGRFSTAVTQGGVASGGWERTGRIRLRRVREVFATKGALAATGRIKQTVLFKGRAYRGAGSKFTLRFESNMRTLHQVGRLQGVP